jgi:hypothetical protein
MALLPHFYAIIFSCCNDNGVEIATSRSDCVFNVHIASCVIVSLTRLFARPLGYRVAVTSLIQVVKHHNILVMI